MRQETDEWWLVSPTGQRFFSLGICEFNQGTEQQHYDQDKPSYAAWKYHSSPSAWAKTSVERLKSWGFTTLGAWSDYNRIDQTGDQGLWMTPVLNLGARTGAPWFDMWDAKVVRQIEEAAQATISPFRGDPRVIGYYSDNEIGWWNAAMWKMTLEQPASSGQRQRLVRAVHEAYAEDWQRLLADFEPQGAASWQELDRGGMLWLRPGGSGIRTMRRFLEIAGDRYYQLMRDAIHKHDPGALYLGDRYQSFYYPELAASARPYVDVISTNLNASWNDGTFLNSYLDTLHKISGKPIIVGEFYVAAKENNSGNENKVGEFPAVATQQQRRDSLTNTLRALAQLPYVVGADWFQYYDEPPHGRQHDREDYNFGLVDIHDRPYDHVTSAFAALDLKAMKSAPPADQASSRGGIPPAPPQPFDEIEFGNALKSWDRKRGYVPASSPFPTGDLYACWTPSALYLATYVIDVVEPEYYRDGRLVESARALWNVELDARRAISARVGAGKNATISDPQVRAISLSGILHDVRCITAMEIPASFIGRERFAPGDRISLHSTFDSHARANRMEWNAEFVLAE